MSKDTQRLRHGLLRTAVLIGLPLLTPGAVCAETDAELAVRGAYLTRIMVCSDCHSPRGPDGAPMVEAGLIGGNIGFQIPGLGTFWPPNLTPDETGLGGWTREDIISALRTGVRPDGRVLAPAMPWPAYAGLTDEDAAAIAEFLLSSDPVLNSVPGPTGPDEAAPAPYWTLGLP